MSHREIAAIALGSNLGDRAANLNFAIHRLAAHLTDLHVSPIIETEPVGVVGAQPNFLNAAATGLSDRSAAELLRTLLEIEREAGRERPFPGAPRALDLDLILFGGQITSDDGLIVPHPRFRDRRFVLEPLAQIAPDLVDPVSGRTIRDLLAALS